MYVCIYVCTYLCMYVCLNVCMYISYIYVIHMSYICHKYTVSLSAILLCTPVCMHVHLMCKDVCIINIVIMIILIFCIGIESSAASSGSTKDGNSAITSVGVIVDGEMQDLVS